MLLPDNPKLYHIVHVDRLPSIVGDGCLWCDAEATRRRSPGTNIGIPGLKTQRLNNQLTSWPNIRVGDCVPFYFCPRSVMLYLLHKGNRPGLTYYGGQEPIVHLEADLRETVAWANRNGKKWVFTPSNAGSLYVEDFCSLDQLNRIDWNAVSANIWHDCMEGKQAEFLLEEAFPWELVQHIGVCTKEAEDQVLGATQSAQHQPPIQVQKNWYY